MMATQSSRHSHFLAKWIGVALLYALAAPVYIAKAVLRLARVIAGFGAVRRGWVDCPHCGNRNAFDILATCRRCGVTEFGSRLWCSNCRQTNRGFPCDRCGAFIRVLS
jgi:hypothetical protein